MGQVGRTPKSPYLVFFIGVQLANAGTAIYRNGVKIPASILLLCTLLSAPAAIASDELVEAMIALEQALMERLARQQRPGVKIEPFRSDGCSGGMSAAWPQLGNLYAPLALQIGNKPPWEHCCVEHDRHYWRGPGRNGYQLRLQADRELRQCVLRTGQRQQLRWAQQLDITPAEVIDIFTLSADMMFRAVRIGGGPCTGLPWRWGHGWPECNPVREPGFD